MVAVETKFLHAKILVLYGLDSVSKALITMRKRELITGKIL